MFGLGPWDMMIVLVIAVLLFGKRLPEVAKSLGKGVTEFRKGIRGIEDEMTRSDHDTHTPSRVAHYEDRAEANAPRFEPPPAQTAEAPASDAQAAEKASV